MSKYSVYDPDTEQHEAIIFRRRKIDDLRITNVFVGQKFIGEIHQLHAPESEYKSTWTSISSARHPLGFRSVNGFRTRWDAAVYLMRCVGMTNND